MLRGAARVAQPSDFQTAWLCRFLEAFSGRLDFCIFKNVESVNKIFPSMKILSKQHCYAKFAHCRILEMISQFPPTKMIRFQHSAE